MSVPIESDPTKVNTTNWNYVEIQVRDGDRVLSPTHIAFDRLIFSEPPKLCSSQIEIVITNNGIPHSSQARVLPHEPGATYIPIQVIVTEQEARARRTA